MLTLECSMFVCKLIPFIFHIRPGIFMYTIVTTHICSFAHETNVSQGGNTRIFHNYYSWRVDKTTYRSSWKFLILFPQMSQNLWPKWIWYFLKKVSKIYQLHLKTYIITFKYYYYNICKLLKCFMWFRSGYRVLLNWLSQNYHCLAGFPKLVHMRIKV